MRFDHQRDKAVRECAALLLQCLAGQEHKLPYSRGIVAGAYRLLSFERLISPDFSDKAEGRVAAFKLSPTGKRHVSRHGYMVYPQG